MNETAPAAPAPAALVLCAAAIELARRAWWLLGCLLLNPRTPAIAARLVMVLPRAVVLAVLTMFAPYVVRGFCELVVAAAPLLDTAGRFVADALSGSL